MKSDALYVEHILGAIARIEAYMAGVERNDFFANHEKQDAVVRQLEIIGEASSHLSEAFRSRHPEIPWRGIIGMRNRIVHDYINIDLDIVWDVVETDLPSLKEQLR